MSCRHLPGAIANFQHRASALTAPAPPPSMAKTEAPMIPVLTRDAIEPLMDWLALTDALAEGHRQPPAQIRDVLMARGDDRLLSRSAWIDGLGLGVKSVTITPGNAARPEPPGR